MGLIIDEKIKKTKIFAMNEYDTIATYDEESAIEFYKKVYDADDDTIDFPIKQKLLTDSMYVEVDEGTLNATFIGDMWCVKRTFAEVLKDFFEAGKKLPYMIASTER